MISDRQGFTSLSTAVGRWSGIGPYYAMFPLDFAFDVVAEHSRPGENVLDPFAGRGSSIYAAAALGRQGFGIEISPVGWLYSCAKLAAAPREEVLTRLGMLSQMAKSLRPEVIACLPEFYDQCFAPDVLRFLVTARAMLHWRTDASDATLMALILVYLHGKMGQALSNQMRQGKAMAPDYALRWWRERDMSPPNIDPHAFMQQRVEWRYEKGRPSLVGSQVVLGDCMRCLPRLNEKVSSHEMASFSLLFTSPPYYGVTNYHYDQWLRLWLLGGTSLPMRPQGPSQGKFTSRTHYEKLIFDTFARSVPLVSQNATIYVRTDAREFTYGTTIRALKAAFPRKHLSEVARPFLKQTQTALYGDSTAKPGEVDIILTP
ncbi:MAG: DNA methyltransferase [Armatimonadota bacterium]